MENYTATTIITMEIFNCIFAFAYLGFLLWGLWLAVSESPTDSEKENE